MPEASAPKTLRDILTSGERYLAALSVQEPRAGLEHLAACLYRCGRLDLQMRLDQTMPEPLVEAMRRGLKRLATGEPVQHILGKWDFHGHVFKTDRRALIPRPETEILVDLVLGDRDLWTRKSPRILDIGTGSGCIALSLALERPDARYLATDVSEEAIALAKENAALHQKADAVTFLVCEDLSDVLEPGSVDAIVSNPPYIPSAVVDRLDRSVRDFEPRLALDGGPDGMALLNDIAEEASLLLADGGKIFFELDAESGQAPKIAALLADLGFDRPAIHRDYAGRERFVSAALATGV